MARTRKPANGTADASRNSSPKPATNNDSPSRSQSDSLRPPRPLSIIISDNDRDTIKVNNASVSELKHACDDALKRFLSRPDLFKQQHLHTDVRLALGWAGVGVAGFTGLYGWKVEFEKSKPVVWVGLIVYFLLTAVQTLYAYFIEGDIVFVGKRKTFSKRIITERLTITSNTEPVKKHTPPAYALSATYVQSASGGKSLLARGKANESRTYNAFFDEAGVMNQAVFEQWVGGLVERVMEGRDT
jgi:signal peptidase complex subunit 2